MKLYFTLEKKSQTINEPRRIKIINYVSLLDIYDANYTDIKASFPDFLFATLKKDDKTFLIRMDVYGNLVNSKIITADKTNFYFDYQKKHAWSVLNTHQDIYLVKWDYMCNPVASYRLEIRNAVNYVYPVFLDSNEIGFLVDNKTILWIFYKENHMKNKLSFSIKEYSTNQDIILAENINSNPLVFNVNQLDKTHSLLLDTKTFKQYLLNGYLTRSYCISDSIIYLIVNKDNYYYLALISKNMKINSFLINSTQNYQNYNVKIFQDHLVLSFEDYDSLYFAFFDENLNMKKSFKISNLTDDYQVFSNILGLFVFSRYNGFPLMIKMDDQINNSNFLNFSLIPEEKLDLNLLKDTSITLNPYEILNKSAKMNIKIEKINLDIQDQEVFTKFYGIL